MVKKIKTINFFGMEFHIGTKKIKKNNILTRLFFFLKIYHYKVTILGEFKYNIIIGNYKWPN